MVFEFPRDAASHPRGGTVNARRPPVEPALSRRRLAPPWHNLRVATIANGARATEILSASGAILTGDHFVYVTGEHGDGWIDKDAIFPHTMLTDELCAMLADATRHLAIDYVCGPATGGLIVSQWTAHHLGVPSLFADHDKDARRGPRLRGVHLPDRDPDSILAGGAAACAPNTSRSTHGTPTARTSWRRSRTS